MELYGRNTARNGSQPDPSVGWAAVGTGTGLEESVRRMGPWGRGLYPERPGVPDCTYYMRTGACGYGSQCRYNHPRDSSSAGGALRVGGEYPERVGEPPCQYYLRTGTCKFGASCKFNHPKNAVGLSDAPLNIYGYPLRLDEKECSYYLKTGQCKFGITCKFHHPQPAGMSLPASARPFYPTVQSPSAASMEQYGGGSANYRVARPPLLPSSYVPGAYGPLLLPPGVVPIPNWSPYSGVGPVSTELSPGARPSVGTASLYGISQLSSAPTAFAGPYPPLPLSGGPSSSSSGQKERAFPERPGEQECQYYMKTGDCKYGSSCRFHHPPDQGISKTILSALGLPLRQGEQTCSFYLQKGYCKFGRTCKFDHPMESVRYSLPASSLTKMPATPFVRGSSQTPISFSELRPEFISGSRAHSSLNSLSSSVGLIFPQIGPASC